MCGLTIHYIRNDERCEIRYDEKVYLDAKFLRNSSIFFFFLFVIRVLYLYLFCLVFATSVAVVCTCTLRTNKFKMKSLKCTGKLTTNTTTIRCKTRSHVPHLTDAIQHVPVRCDNSFCMSYILRLVSYVATPVSVYLIKLSKIGQTY